MVQFLHPYMTPGRNIALTILAGKVMSLLLNMLSRLVIAFLERSKHLLISWHLVISWNKSICFFWNSPCSLHNPVNVGNLISVPLSFLNPAWTSRSSLFTWCWSLACKIFSMTLLTWEMSAIIWWLAHSLALHFLGIGMRIDLFRSCGHCWVFQICWCNECKPWWHSPLDIWIVLLEFHHIH